MTFQQKVIEFFTNVKLLKAIRSIAIAVLIIGLPMLYYGYAESFTFEALFDWSFGVMVVIITTSVILATIETKNQCFDLTCDTDKDIPTLHNTINDNAKEIRKRDKVGKRSLLWLGKYNREQQKLYDELLTNEYIDKLERKALSHRINGKEKQASKIDREIEKLRKNPLQDKNFVPYSIKKILNVDKHQFKLNKKKGNNEINVNPKRVNWVTTFFSMIVRSSGVGVLGTIPFAVKESTSTIIYFYLGYIVVIVITILTQWLLTSYITTHPYKNGLNKITDIQDLLLAELNTTELKYQLHNHIEDKLNENSKSVEFDLPFTDLQQDYSKGELE